MDTVCVPKTPKASLLFNKVSSKFDHGVVGDMTEAYSLFGYCALIALGISLVFLILICMCTSLISWILILALFGVLLSFGALILVNIHYTGPLNNGINAARVKYLHFIMSNKKTMTFIGIVLILASFLLMYLVCKFKKYVKSAIPILAIASKASLKNILLIFLSIVTIIL